MPVHLRGTKTSYASSEVNRSSIVGQAARIAGVTCVSRSVLYMKRASSVLIVRSIRMSSGKLVGSRVSSSSDAKAQTNPDGSPRYRATTFRSWLSIFSKLWRHRKC